MQVYTTGQAAKLLQVAPRTVGKWFDSGRLKGYVIPGSQDRRIPQDSLIKFLEDHGMPIPRELQQKVIEDAQAELFAKSMLPAQIRLLHSTLQTRLAYCSTDRDTITHLLQFRDNVMKAINDN